MSGRRGVCVYFLNSCGFFLCVHTHPCCSNYCWWIGTYLFPSQAGTEASQLYVRQLWLIYVAVMIVAIRWGCGLMKWSHKWQVLELWPKICPAQPQILLNYLADTSSPACGLGILNRVVIDSTNYHSITDPRICGCLGRLHSVDTCASATTAKYIKDPSPWRWKPTHLEFLPQCWVVIGSPLGIAWIAVYWLPWKILFATWGMCKKHFS